MPSLMGRSFRFGVSSHGAFIRAFFFFALPGMPPPGAAAGVADAIGMGVQASDVTVHVRGVTGSADASVSSIRDAMSPNPPAGSAQAPAIVARDRAHPSASVAAMSVTVQDRAAPADMISRR